MPKPKRFANAGADAPTLEEWRDLYAAADAFREIACWDWMTDSDLFGVRNPESGEIGYCCVLGNLGESFGLNVYPGSAGLQTYLRILMSDAEEDEDNLFELAREQWCLHLSFLSKKELDKRDIELIKSLGLTYRGAARWPVFRYVAPGRYPWNLSSSQARFLTCALRQAPDVALRVRENRPLLTPREDGICLVRVRDGEDERAEWKDLWLVPEPYEPPKLGGEGLDDSRMRKLKATLTERCSALEIDIFRFPEAIQEDESQAPIYPWMLLVVEHQLGIALTMQIAEDADYVGQFREAILNVFESLGGIPDRIYVKRDLALQLVEPLALALGIPLTLARLLAQLDRAKKALTSHMGSLR